MTSIAMLMFTIRESIRRGTLIFYFVIGTLIIVFFAFAIKLSPDDGTTPLLLGKPMTFRGPFKIDPVEFILVQLVRSAGGSLLLIGIFAMAGLVPSMLEKGTAELYLSKPISRTSLLLSRAMGAASGIGLNIIYFAIGILLVFGIKVGVWHWPLLLSALMIAVTFTFFYSLVALVGLVTKSQGFSIILAFVFWLSSGVLEKRQGLLFDLWDNVVYHRFLDVLYYVTPQVSEMMENSYRLVGANPFDRMLVQNAPVSFDIMPFVYSFLSASALYAFSAWYFSKQDY